VGERQIRRRRPPSASHLETSIVEYVKGVDDQQGEDGDRGKRSGSVFIEEGEVGGEIRMERAEGGICRPERLSARVVGNKKNC